MLETPKADTTESTVKTCSDDPMDNEQAIVQVAMLYVGEGHFTLRAALDKRSNRRSFKTEVGFTNSEPILLDFVCTWLRKNDIRHSMRQCTGCKRPCFQIHVQKFGEIVRLINLIEPWMLGEKKAQARILRAFCLKRLEKKNKGANCQRHYDASDEHFLTEKQSIRESSEATRAPSCVCKMKTWSTPTAKA